MLYSSWVLFLCAWALFYDQRQYHLPYYIARIGLTGGGSSSLMIKIQVSLTCFCTCMITTSHHGMRSVLNDS